MQVCSPATGQVPLAGPAASTGSECASDSRKAAASAASARTTPRRLLSSSFLHRHTPSYTEKARCPSLRSACHAPAAAYLRFRSCEGTAKGYAVPLHLQDGLYTQWAMVLEGRELRNCKG